MHSSTYAKMLRLEQKGPSYAGLSNLLFIAYQRALDRQRAVKANLDPIIASLASGEMDAAAAAEALAEIREQIQGNNHSMMAVVWAVMMSAFPMIREAEAAKMGAVKRRIKAGKVTPIREASRTA